MAKKKDSWWLFSEIRKSLKHGKKRGAEINSYMEKLSVGYPSMGRTCSQISPCPKLYSQPRTRKSSRLRRYPERKVLLPMLEE
ncbi:MAG: hypothetical protein AAF757_22820 [Cyanobacteria bacterium P01_D01_bin.116]